MLQAMPQPMQTKTRNRDLPFSKGPRVCRKQLIQRTLFNYRRRCAAQRRFSARRLVEVATAVHFAAADEVLVASGGEQLAAGLEAALHPGVQNFDHGSIVLPFPVVSHFACCVLNLFVPTLYKQFSASLPEPESRYSLIKGHEERRESFVETTYFYAGRPELP